MNQQTISAPLPRAEVEVLAIWEEKLRATWGKGPRLNLFRDAIATASDPFRYLLAVLGQRPQQDKARIIFRNIERVHAEVFLLADLFTEIRILTELLEKQNLNALEVGDSEFGSIAEAREILWDFYEVVARETSVIYETFSEQGSQGLVFLDRDGNITYANRSARDLLGDDDLSFDQFASRLSAEDRQRFGSMLQRLKSNSGDSPGTMLIRPEINGSPKTIKVEASHTEHGSERSVFYLSLSSPQLFGVDDDRLEKFDHGVVRVDTDKRIVYANDAAKRLLGLSAGNDRLPRHVHEFFEEGKDRDRIDLELRKREAGKLSQYMINISRPSGRKVPVSIFAVPEKNSLGIYTGSIAFITNLEVEHATNDFNHILLESHSWKERLEGLCRWLFKRFAADLIGVAQYTDDLRYSSAIASLESDGREFKIQRRWYELSSGLRTWMQEPGVKLEGNLPEFLEQPFVSYLKTDPTIRYLVDDKKMLSFMATPILQDNSYKAGITFMSTELDKFSDDDAELLERLPLKNFVMSALQRKHHEEKAFQARLVSELSKCESFESIAEKITSELADYFKWDNVSIFDVAEDLGHMILLKQAPGSKLNFMLRKDFTQNHTVGVLGRAVRQMRSVYVPDVDKDPDFVRGHKLTKSELVVPIFSRLYQPRRVFWLLNIEDSMASFLLEPEIRMIEDIASQIEFIVNSMIERETYERALNKTSDGVIITDANGTIRLANPAACQILNFDPDPGPLGRDIGSLFADKQMAENFRQGKFSDSHKVDLLRNQDESPVSVLLSRLEMSERISDKYYLFKNLESQKRLANLAAVERLVSVAANQVKTPLGLAQGLLHRLAHANQQLEPEKISSFVERTRSLLKKAELSYDRVAYCDSIASAESRITSYVHIDNLFARLNRELSGDSPEIFKIARHGKEHPVSGDRHQIRFVCESVTSYLLRNLTPGNQICVDLKYGDGRVDISLVAMTDRRQSADIDEDDTDWDRAVLEASLGHSVIRQIVAQHDGVYQGPLIDSESGELGFQLSFPTIDG